MIRHGQIIKVKPEKLDYYCHLHANPWPEITAAINECNIRNYSIFYRDGYLFAYYEYIGNDYDADMKRLNALSEHWHQETDPCQCPVENALPGEWWREMSEVFYQQ